MEENKKHTKKEKYELSKKQKAEQKLQAAKKQKAKKMVIWGSTSLIIVASLWGVVKLASNQAPDLENVKLSNEVTAEDHVAGNAESGVVLVAYEDFQCPACRSYTPMLKEMKEEYGDSIAFVFRHFPLRQIHRNAQLASQAAVAAESQGMFWEMHDMLYAEQPSWSNIGNPEDTFVGYAEDLGLNTEQFRNDMLSDASEQRVNNDYDSGFSSGVSGTPTFFLNGDKIQNPRDYDELKALLDGALAN
ncbi:MAG: DsbA family protein [Candidatus Spechtbacterales bacterium]